MEGPQKEQNYLWGARAETTCTVSECGCRDAASRHGLLIRLRPGDAGEGKASFWVRLSYSNFRNRISYNRTFSRGVSGTRGVPGCPWGVQNSVKPIISASFPYLVKQLEAGDNHPATQACG
jgi:hypothetical protein